MSGELTGPQLELLLDVAAGRNKCTKTYSPAQRLVRDGLCTWRDGHDDILVITEVGRRAMVAEAAKS